MAGLFDFDKTLLAALDARQKRDMYEQERADRNAQWQQSFDLQNKEFLERAQQFRETIAENKRQRDFTATQNELNRKAEREGNVFRFRSTLIPDDGKGIGSLGSEYEKNLGDLGDAEFENTRWISPLQASMYQSDLDERYRSSTLALQREQMDRLYPKETGIEQDNILESWKKTADLLPFQESDYKNIVYNIENYKSKIGGSAPSGGWDLSDFKELSGRGNIEEVRMKKKAEEEAKDYGKKTILQKFDEAEELSKFIGETGVTTTKVDRKGAVLFDASLQNFQQHYLYNPGIAETNEEGKITNEKEVSAGLLTKLGQYAVEKGYMTQGEFLKRLDRIKKNIENATVGGKGMTAVDQLTKSKQYLERLYNE